MGSSVHEPRQINRTVPVLDTSALFNFGGMATHRDAREYQRTGPRRYSEIHGNHQNVSFPSTQPELNGAPRCRHKSRATETFPFARKATSRSSSNLIANGLSLTSCEKAMGYQNGASERQSGSAKVQLRGRAGGVEETAFDCFFSAKVTLGSDIFKPPYKAHF